MPPNSGSKAAIERPVSWNADQTLRSISPVSSARAEAAPATIANSLACCSSKLWHGAKMDDLVRLENVSRHKPVKMGPFLV